MNLLAEFIIRVDDPSWFEIKNLPKATHGARNLHGIITKSSLPEKCKKVVVDFIQRNAYFAHSENLILAMLQDERQHIREHGLRRIIKFRGIIRSSGIRPFHIPKSNFSSQEY